MHNVISPKSNAVVIARLSNAEALAGVRKVAVRGGQAHRDKRNDYQRKPKFHRGWE